MTFTNYAHIRLAFHGRFAGLRPIDTQDPLDPQKVRPWLIVSAYADRIKDVQGSLDTLQPDVKPAYQNLSSDSLNDLKTRYFQKTIPTNIYCSKHFPLIPYLQAGMSFKATLIGVNRKQHEGQTMWLNQMRKKDEGQQSGTYEIVPTRETYQWHILGIE